MRKKKPEPQSPAIEFEDGEEVLLAVEEHDPIPYKINTRWTHGRARVIGCWWADDYFDLGGKTVENGDQLRITIVLNPDGNDVW